MISIAKNIFIVFEKTIRLSADALIVSADPIRILNCLQEMAHF